MIVGAGPAGLSTARAYRACGGEAEVTLVGEEPLLPYRRPPLTKELVRGELGAHELAIETEDWFAANDVKLLRGARVTSIAPEEGVVTLESYVRLPAETIVLAAGSRPARPPIAGAEHPDVHTIRTLADSERVIAALDSGQRAVVVGTGFIGCELAASLALRGVAVTLIGQERLPQLARLGELAARRIAAWLAELGVELRGESSLAAVHEGRIVELDDESRHDACAVILATGVHPRGELAQASGIQTSDAGAVIVDAAMRARSAHGNVLAVGDVACAFNACARRHLRVEHWGDALGHGEVAGRTLAHGDGCWEEVPGFWSTIGAHTLKYAAWGDGFESSHALSAPDGSFTVWYERDGATVGVLTHERDEEYERGRELIAAGEPAP